MNFMISSLFYDNYQHPYYRKNISKTAITITPAIMGNAFRLASSMGLLTPARPQATIAAPAIGDIVRPRQPAIAALLPKFIGVIPKLAAYGVTALLNATEAASPDPQRTASKKGPKVPVSFAMAG